MVLINVTDQLKSRGNRSGKRPSWVATVRGTIVVTEKQWTLFPLGSFEISNAFLLA